MAADGALPVPGAEEIVAPMRDWLAGLRPLEETAAVLFTFDTHVPEIYAVSEEAKEFPPHCVKGAPGWELVVDPRAVHPGHPLLPAGKGECSTCGPSRGSALRRSAAIAGSAASASSAIFAMTESRKPW